MLDIFLFPIVLEEEGVGNGILLGFHVRDCIQAHIYDILSGGIKMSRVRLARL